MRLRMRYFKIGTILDSLLVERESTIKKALLTIAEDESKLFADLVTGDKSQHLKQAGINYYSNF